MKWVVRPLQNLSNLQESKLQESKLQSGEMCALLLVTLLSMSFLNAEDETSKELEIIKKEKVLYLSLMSNYSADVEEIFNNYPIYTNISFLVPNVYDNVLDKLFTDLVFTSKAAKQYAKSPYLLTKKDNHYFAEIPDLIEGKIYITSADTEQNRYIYLVEGYYDTFVTLRGKMIIDIKYVRKGKVVQFFVKSYVIVTNSVLWRLARYLKSYPSFQKKIDELFSKNIRYTIRIGKRTVYGIQRNIKKNKF